MYAVNLTLRWSVYI